MKQGTKKFLSLLLFTAFCVSCFSSQVLADDDAKTNAPASTDTGKLAAPKPGLTERERWLLDKVERLERRVAELEGKSQPATIAAAPPASPAASTPGETGLAGPSAASPHETTS